MSPQCFLSILLFLSTVSLNAQDQAPPPASTNEKMVRNIHIIGVQGDDLKKILSTRVGMTFDPKTLASDLAAIEKLSTYTNIRSEIARNDDGSVKVIFRMDKKPAGPAN